MDTDEIRRLTHSEAVDRLHSIAERLEQLSGKHRLSKRDEQEFISLRDEFDATNRRRETLERRHQLASVGRNGDSGGYRVIPGTERDSTTGNDDDDGPRPHMRGQRTAAMRVLDGLVDGNQLPARSAEAVEALTRTGSPIEQDWTARVVQATGSRDYLKAFSRLVADPNRGHLLWTPQEQEAFRRVEQLRAETRALSTVDSAGGYLSPLQLDPAVLITSAGNVNPLRQISRVVQTVSDTWNGVTSAGVTAEWLAEAAEASDASPTFAQPSIPVFKQSAFIPFSYEIAQDATNFTQEIGKLLVDGLDQLSATAYTTGSGTGQPTGIITALAASSPTVVVNTATPDTLVAGDVYALQNALPPRFSTNAQWCAALPIHNMLRQMETANGALRFPGLHDNPATLLGRTANELSNMDSVIDAGQTNYVLVYGSFEHFVIVDRFPSTLELIPNLFGANRRPTGQRGMFLWARTGSDSVVDNAFRLLQA